MSNSSSPGFLMLDLDGVCNRHYFEPIAESAGIEPECVKHLNTVLDKTQCRIVISSAWRYVILGRDMTLRGFEYMLRTHGVHCKGRLIGWTEPDSKSMCTDNAEERGQQITKWLDEYMEREGLDIVRYAVVDDMVGGFFDHQHCLVRTDPAVGLTAADADKLVEILGEAQAQTVPW